jgi:dihydrofolate reductase
MRKITEQAVVTLDGQISTPQDWLHTRWAGEFEQLSKDLLKRLASRTLTEVKWNATLLEGDVVAAVRKLKEQPGGDILKIGTGGSFSRTLLKHRLVDEYLFWLFPVIAKNGILGLTYVPTTS